MGRPAKHDKICLTWKSLSSHGLVYSPKTRARPFGTSSIGSSHTSPALPRVRLQCASLPPVWGFEFFNASRIALALAKGVLNALKTSIASALTHSSFTDLARFEKGCDATAIPPAS